MKTKLSEKIIRINGIPKLTQKQHEEIRQLAAMEDKDIDTTDIPKIADFNGFEVGKFYREKG